MIYHWSLLKPFSLDKSDWPLISPHSIFLELKCKGPENI